jgi:hypothetical protein
MGHGAQGEVWGAPTAVGTAVPSGHALTGGRDSCVAFQEALDTAAWLVGRGTYTWFGGAAGEQPCTAIAAANCCLGKRRAHRGSWIRSRSGPVGMRMSLPSRKVGSVAQVTVG